MSIGTYGEPDAVSKAIGYAKFYSRSHDAVIRAYNIVSDDRIDRIVAKRDSALERACARARNIERCDSAVRSAQEPMMYITRVKVGSLNRSCLVDAKRKGALERACARAPARGLGSCYCCYSGMREAVAIAERKQCLVSI
jgi:hypothetical protein